MNRVKNYVISIGLMWGIFFGMSQPGLFQNVYSQDAEASELVPVAAGNVSGVARSTTVGTATIGGQQVEYYTRLPKTIGNCMELVSRQVTYYNCDGTYYRPYYLGNRVVYVIERP
jgi:hypothetical protein